MGNPSEKEKPNDESFTTTGKPSSDGALRS
jgi:hypothetical protein